jgi:hypothetical protein
MNVDYGQMYIDYCLMYVDYCRMYVDDRKCEGGYGKCEGDYGKAEMGYRQFFDKHLPPDGIFGGFSGAFPPLDCFWAFGEVVMVWCGFGGMVVSKC